MANNSQTAVALTSDKGDETPLQMPNPFAVTGAAASQIKATIEAAKAAQPGEFTDVTPIYWEARRGEQIIGVFLGWKQVLKVDEKTGEEQPKYFAVFHDGDRQIVAGQLALTDAMFGRPTGKVYRITCEEAVAGKAKKFKVEEYAN